MTSRSKYHAKPVQANGQRFDSRKEYRRWCELKTLERAGVISDLERQVKYTLVPAQRDCGKAIRAVCYIADFRYTQNGSEVVEDCKGYRTEVYKLKKKLMLWVHGVSIRET